MAEQIRHGTILLLVFAALLTLPSGLSGQAGTGSDDVVSGEIFEMEEFRVFSNAQDIALDLKKTNDRAGNFLSADALGIQPHQNNRLRLASVCRKLKT